MQLPSIQNYGQYSSDNYGVNTLKVYVGDLTLWFSYRTIVAFRDGWQDLVIRQNDWGTTTGKHLNWIDSDKSKRISGAEFEEKLAEVLKKYSVETGAN